MKIKQIICQLHSDIYVCISHTLSTIVENANRIDVIELGKIKENGSLQELRTKIGLHAKMWRKHCVSRLRKNKYCF